MNNCLYAQNLGTIKKPKRNVSFMLGGIVAAVISAYQGINCLGNIIAESKQSPKSAASEVKPTIPIDIPRRYEPCFAKLHSLGVSEDSLEGIAKTAMTESKFRHKDYKGRCIVAGSGDAGLFQITKIAIQDAVQNALDGYSPTKADKISDFLVKTYLKKIPRRDLANFSVSRKARKNAVNIVYNLIKRDDIANFYIGSAIWLYKSREARMQCSRYNVQYDAELTDKAYNAPKRTLLAVKRMGENWRDCHLLPTVTRERKYSRYFVPESEMSRITVKKQRKM